MDDDSDLILALMEAGLEPTSEAVRKLDIDCIELAETLVDYYLYKKGQDETLRNARIGLVAELKRVVRRRCIVPNIRPGLS